LAEAEARSFFFSAATSQSLSAHASSNTITKPSALVVFDVDDELALDRALIASGALWCVADISAGLTRGSEINAQATRTESAQTVLIKTAQANPETDRKPAFGERWGVTTSSMCWRKSILA
jgi:hypothetical protein